MLVYRLEHKISGLGPFEHATQYASIVKSLVFHKDPDSFKELYAQHTAEHVFGWSTQEACLSFTKPGRDGLFVRYKFTRNVYEVHEADAIIYPDGQVSFLKDKAVLVGEIPFKTKLQSVRDVSIGYIAYNSK